MAEHRPYDRSSERQQRIDTTLARRQPGLVVVLENVHDPHNIGAILRSCDAVGVMHVMMIYTIEEPPNIRATTSASGVVKWLNFHRYSSVKACYDRLHADGFQILATKIEPAAKQVYSFDLSRPTAIVVGNEHRGVSEEAAAGADDLLYIPMMGMAESVNVSVAAAICLFEALRQRLANGMYDEPQIARDKLSSLKAEWSRK
jgi:tRNA (guanosine-2'-O-)-methyltransferase